MVVLREKLVIGVHELALAHGGGSLLAGHILGPAFQRELAHAHTDGAGGDQSHLMACIFQITEHLAQLLHLTNVQPSGGMCNGGGAHFYYDSHCCPPLTAFPAPRSFRKQR